MKKTIIFLAFMLFSVLIFAQNVRLIGIQDSTKTFGTTYPINTLVLEYASNKLYKLDAAVMATTTLFQASKSLVSGSGGNVNLEEIIPLVSDTATAVRAWVTDKNYLTSFTETDPIFNSQKSNYALQSWVTSQNYLTSFTETDPIFTASQAFSISATDKSNWNTAYGWGNHATAGYLKAYSETDPLWTAQKSSYALQSWVTSQNYLTSFTESDPLWTAQKVNYALQSWVTSQNFLKTESDPLWTAQKSLYATIQALHDTASILRDDFNKFVVIDNSGLWVSTGSEVIFSSTNDILTVKNNKTYNFVKSSNNSNYVYLDSIEITSLADVEIVATVKGTTQIGTFKHSTAYNSVSGVLSAVGINTSEIKCPTYPNTHFSYDVRASWLRFKAKSSELVTWKYKVSINYN